MNYYCLFSVGITVAFSQLLFVVREGDGSVQVCAEITMGGIPATSDMVSVSVSANLGNSSGNLVICRAIYIGPNYMHHACVRIRKQKCVRICSIGYALVSCLVKGVLSLVL